MPFREGFDVCSARSVPSWGWRPAERAEAKALRLRCRLRRGHLGHHHRRLDRNIQHEVGMFQHGGAHTVPKGNKIELNTFPARELSTHGVSNRLDEWTRGGGDTVPPAKPSSFAPVELRRNLSSHPGVALRLSHQAEVHRTSTPGEGSGSRPLYERAALPKKRKRPEDPRAGPVSRAFASESPRR